MHLSLTPLTLRIFIKALARKLYLLLPFLIDIKYYSMYYCTVSDINRLEWEF